MSENTGKVICEAAKALRFRALLYDFIDLLHIRPTMPVGLNIVAITRHKAPTRRSCCVE